jgi:hypothetical protein
MKRLDDTTLEVIAETICGAGEGAGGGYESPGPYRTKSQIYDFFQRAGVKPRGTSSTRKWFVLESLQALNGTNSLERVLRRLASPKEYRNDADMTQAVIDHLNLVLQLEGVEITLMGVDAVIRERTATASPPKPREKPIEAPPEFHRLVQDSGLSAILAFRWEEAQRCARASAYLSAVVMMGSVLEGVLLHKVEQNRKTANQARSAPKDRDGKPRPIHEWSLAALIDVAHEVRWLQGDVKRFSHALRESRNIVHPYVERLLTERPDEHTCAICWQVVRAAVADFLGID